MSVENIDFDDLPEGDFEDKEKLISLTLKVPKDVRDMFAKIAHRERRNMLSLGGIVIEDYIKDYVNKYKQDKNQ